MFYEATTFRNASPSSSKVNDDTSIYRNYEDLDGNNVPIMIWGYYYRMKNLSDKRKNNFIPPTNDEHRIEYS